ncbi:hypothetical protein BGZ63DRAFT_416090 [Mariannaea sp. PMI_226]|nr:hypothetical protein BGZ63DRAFT_416090 [Mariannaea sp. PMI_226]
MHRNLRRIGYASTSAKILPHRCSTNILASPPIQHQPPTALVLLPSTCSYLLYGRLISSGPVSVATTIHLANNPGSESTNLVQPFEWSEDQGLGQGEPHHVPKNQTQGEDTDPQHGVRRYLWEEAVWEHFLDLRNRASFSSIIDPRAEPLRNRILTAALSNESRLVVFYQVVQHIRDELNFEWPELYTRVIHHYLGNNEYDAAYMWHLRLMPIFAPNVGEFGALLASFAVGLTRTRKDILKVLYVLSPFRQVYDHLIPTLFENGHSQVARSWRKFLIAFGDLPSNSRARPFLDFCSRYYPLASLTETELAIFRGHGFPSLEPEKLSPSTSRLHEPKGKRGIYGDSFTARWFASSWASVEFAIDLMYKLGLKTIGPRSLQSLALREGDAEGVASCIAQLESLGITIMPTAYCRTLVAFAKAGRQDLLTDLVNCDIHPEEFDDAETRRMLMGAAQRQQNQKREHLLREMELLIIGQPEPIKQPPHNNQLQYLNQQFEVALAKGALAKARLILDKMESANVSLSQANAAKILRQIFQDLWFSPKRTQQRQFGKGKDPHLDRAIQIVRRVARHDVAIPLKHWRIILYNLGRLGRFEELEELSHDIVDMYTLAPESQIPIHAHDLPPSHAKFIAEDNGPKINDAIQPKDTFSEVTEGWPTFSDDFWDREMGHNVRNKQQGSAGQPDQVPVSPRRRRQKRERPELQQLTYYMPRDLPLKHQQHPIAKLFDSAFQRAVVRWSFDHKLALPASQRSIISATAITPADFDLAWGVRFLAILYDRGLHIDKQILRTSLYSRILLAQVPGREKHRSRDQRELAPANLKRLIDEAWGEELLPALPIFIRQLEDQKPKIWHRYPRLFMKAYDQQGLQEIADGAQQNTRREPSRITDKEYD